MSRFARSIPAIAAVVALAAVPSAAGAKTYTFGSRLDHEPSNSAPGHNCREDGSDDPTPTCTRVGIDASIAVPGGLRAPRNGTIVAFKVRAGAPGTLTFRLARLSGLGFDEGLDAYVGDGRAAGRGPTVQVQGLGFAEDERDAVETFKANLKVKRGDYLAIDSTATSAEYCASGGDKQLIFSPPLGGGRRQSTQTGGCDLLVQAVMKPARKR